MKYLKVLILAVVAVFAFGSANAQVRAKVIIGGRGNHHREVVVHHRYHRPIHRRVVVEHRHY